MHRHSVVVLSYLKKKGSSSLDELEKATGLNVDQLMWNVEELKALGAVTYMKRQDSAFHLTAEGLSYTDTFPEERFVQMLLIAEREGKAVRPADVKENEKIGFLWAKKNGWIVIEDSLLRLTEQGKRILGSGYPLRNALNAVAVGSIDADRKMLDILKGRGLCELKEKSVIDRISVTEHGRSLVIDVKERIMELDRETILTGNWKGKHFEEYDIKASARLYPGRMHPMHDFIDRVKEAWLSMGFSEADGPVVNPAFWNFDVLFTPQDHPARDAHDTFFLTNPMEREIREKKVAGQVKRMHESNWKGKWDYQTSKRHVLRTHNTVVSAREIMELGNLDSGSYPVKRFFTGRVFRNESPDYKHLAEFYQSEGIIIGDELSLSNLIYELREFFGRVLGRDAGQIRIRPSYFPFTEPSLEVFYFDKRHNDFVELGGAGIIRREICEALGTKKRVLAWGLGLDRLLLNLLELDDINEIYSNKISWLRERNEV